MAIKEMSVRRRAGIAAASAALVVGSLLTFPGIAQAASCTTNAKTLDSYVLGGKYVELRTSTACGGTAWWRENRTTGTFREIQFGMDYQSAEQRRDGTYGTQYGGITENSVVSNPEVGVVRARSWYNYPGQSRVYRAWYNIAH